MTHSGAFWHQHLVMCPLVCTSPQQVSLGFWLMSLTQQRGVFHLLCTLSQEDGNHPCFVIQHCSYSVLLVPNHGHHSILILSPALIQSIPNWTVSVKANPVQGMANQLLKQLGKSFCYIGGCFSMSEHPRALQGPKNQRIKQSLEMEGISFPVVQLMDTA